MLPTNKNDNFLDTCICRRHGLTRSSDTKDGTSQHTGTLLEPVDDARVNYYYYMDTGTLPETLPSATPEESRRISQGQAAPSPDCPGS